MPKRRPLSLAAPNICVDKIGIVTVQDGPSVESGEIIAPEVGNDAKLPNYHNNFQDPEAFLRAGGRARGNISRSPTAPTSSTAGLRPLK